MVQQSDHTEVLEPREVLVDRGVLAGESDAVAHGARVLDDVETVDVGRTRRWREDRREDADHRGLARSIGTEKPEDLPAWHVQGHVIEGSNLAVFESSDNIERFDGEIGHGCQFREAFVGH